MVPCIPDERGSLNFFSFARVDDIVIEMIDEETWKFERMNEYFANTVEFSNSPATVKKMQSI